MPSPPPATSICTVVVTLQGYSREAFNATMTDPEFLKEAARGSVEVNLVTAEEVEALLRTSAALPPAVIERARQVIERN
jgi:hypothetical protein